MRGSLFKINWDAVYYPKLKNAGFNITIRDSEEELLVACSKCKENIASPKIAKILTLKRAIALSLEFGCTEFIFEGDAKIVIEDN